MSRIVAMPESESSRQGLDVDLDSQIDVILPKSRELVDGLPEPPDASLDPYLDAAAQSFALYGVGHSSVPDIARRMGVSRATVYRRIGTIANAAKLLLARELNYVLTQVARRLSGGPGGPDVIIEVLVWITEHARNHDVLQSVLRSDPELLGPFLTQGFSDVVRRASESVCPIFEAAIKKKQIAPADPAVLADWLVRLIISIGLSPPQIEPRHFFNQVVRPVLDPGPSRKGKAAKGET